jgi:hypothetical protein
VIALCVCLKPVRLAVPALCDRRVEMIVHALESGVAGRIVDLLDLEDGTRVEIFSEQ